MNHLVTKIVCVQFNLIRIEYPSMNMCEETKESQVLTIPIFHIEYKINIPSRVVKIVHVGLG